MAKPRDEVPVARPADSRGPSGGCDASPGVPVPDVVLLFCEHAVASGSRVTSGWRSTPGGSVRLIAIPCSSRVELPQLMSLLARGSSAIGVVGCPEQSCSFLVGSRMASRRIERGRELLAEAGLDIERLGMHTASDLSERDLVDLALGRLEAARAEADPGQGASGR